MCRVLSTTVEINTPYNPTSTKCDSPFDLYCTDLFWVSCISKFDNSSRLYTRGISLFTNPLIFSCYRFVCKNNGVLFENQLLQIGIKSEYRQNLGKLSHVMLLVCPRGIISFLLSVLEMMVSTPLVVGIFFMFT